MQADHAALPAPACFHGCDQAGAAHKQSKRAQSCRLGGIGRAAQLGRRTKLLRCVGAPTSPAAAEDEAAGSITSRGKAESQHLPQGRGDCVQRRPLLVGAGRVPHAHLVNHSDLITGVAEQEGPDMVQGPACGQTNSSAASPCAVAMLRAPPIGVLQPCSLKFDGVSQTYLAAAARPGVQLASAGGCRWLG
jgi:hypothetical protein